MARSIAVACGVVACCAAFAVRAEEMHRTAALEPEPKWHLAAEGDDGEHEGDERPPHAADEAHVHGHEHHPLALGLDFVLGLGSYPATLPLRSAPEGFGFGAPVNVHSESLVVAGGYEVAERFGVGVRVPVTFGTVPNTDDAAHGVFALGNVELEAETELEVNEGATLVISLGVALPTAMGSEEAEFEDGELNAAYDQFVLNRIAASSRGFEDNALFEVDRVGIVPKLQLEVRANQILVLEPFVKLENLIATDSALERGYLAEFVFGTFVGCQLGEHFDLGLRAWGSAAFLDEIESVGVVEPQVRAHFVPVDVVAGGIIPFAGELTEPRFGGIRLGAVVHI